MFAYPDLCTAPIGRRIVQRMPGGRFRFNPACVPEIVAWIRLIGNRYITMLEGIEAKSHTKGDSYINAVRHNTEFRIAQIQDMINLTVDQWGINQWNIALSQTQDELGLTDHDTNPELFDCSPIYTEGEGI